MGEKIRYQEQQNEPLEISAQELEDIFQSDDFQSRLIEAGDFIRQQQRRRYEAGFLTFRNAVDRSGIRYSPVVKGTEIAMLDNWPDQEIGEQMFDGGQLPVLISGLHFHLAPTGARILVPRIDDLEALNRGKLFYKSGKPAVIGKPLSVIGQIGSDGLMELLMLQEQFPETWRYYSEAAKSLDESLGNLRSNSEVVDLLREKRYKAEIAQIEAGHPFAETELQKIANFAFTPEIRSISQNS